MSQVEIWKLQEICREKSEEKRENKKCRILSLGVLIGGFMLMIASLHLISFVLRAGIAMTGPVFLEVGIIGLIAGAAAVVIARSVK